MTASDLCTWEGFLKEVGVELLEKNLIGSDWRKDTESGLFFLFETKFLGSPNS